MVNRDAGLHAVCVSALMHGSNLILSYLSDLVIPTKHHLRQKVENNKMTTSLLNLFSMVWEMYCNMLNIPFKRKDVEAYMQTYANSFGLDSFSLNLWL